MRLTYTRERGAGWARAATYAGGFVLLLWVIEFVDYVLGNSLDDEGVRPRDDEGLIGIVFAPLLHAGWDHLIANTLPLLVLGFLVFLSGIGRALAATAVIWVVGGLGTWLIGDAGTTIGASGIIFGWFAFLLVRGFFARSVGQIVLAVVLFAIYGSLLLGVLPSNPLISWQAHLCGVVTGVLAAWITASADRRVIARP